MPTINAARLLADLHRVGDFGRYKTGVHRPTFSPQDMEARRWLVEKLEEAGLVATIDGVGNVIGRSRAAGPRLLVGSHSESQSHAGWLDGILGVIYGLELARALGEHPACDGLGVDVGAWADEESHFLPFLGSRSFCGDLTEEEIDQAVGHADGMPLRQALAGAGLTGVPRQRMNPADYVGYLEAHIEQGDYLDADGLGIGVVTSIVGIWQYRITFAGQQNHAGTTRMAVRRDAGLAMARLVRVEFMTLRDREFVQSCHAIGMSDFSIITRQILSNALSPVIVTGSIMVATAILTESALSFLGLGDPNVMSWGTMIGAGREMLRTAWYLTAIPGIAILVTVLAINLVGEGLNDALNPKLANR